MKIYLDNDAAKKLAGYELFEGFLNAFSLSPLNVFRRSSMLEIFDLKAKRPDPKLKDSRHQAALLALMKRTHAPAVNNVLLNLQRRLMMNPRIDEGEAQLIAYTSGDPDSAFVTGDKKALKALASADELANVCVSVSGRCIHLEQVLQAIAASSGFASLRAAVLSREPGIDTAIYTALAGGDSDAMAAARLESSVQTLRSQTGGLLRP